MPAPHVIRLRGPWDHEPPSVGGVRSTRKFNCPTNLDPDERVWLVCEAFQHPFKVALNDQSLGHVTAFRAAARYDVTSELRPHNLVAIVVELPHDADPPSGPHDLLGEVRLEIGPLRPELGKTEFDPR